MNSHGPNLSTMRSAAGSSRLAAGASARPERTRFVQTVLVQPPVPHPVAQSVACRLAHGIGRGYKTGMGDAVSKLELDLFEEWPHEAPTGQCDLVDCVPSTERYGNEELALVEKERGQ